jgi:hypothetical protein
LKWNVKLWREDYECHSWVNKIWQPRPFDYSQIFQLPNLSLFLGRSYRARIFMQKARKWKLPKFSSVVMSFHNRIYTFESLKSSHSAKDCPFPFDELPTLPLKLLNFMMDIISVLYARFDNLSIWYDEKLIFQKMGDFIKCFHVDVIYRMCHKICDWRNGISHIKMTR